jgi:hypothetical protein
LFSYRYSLLTTISFSPSFGYQRSTGALDSGQEVNAFLGGGRFGVTHALSSTRTLGFSYLGQYAVYDNTSQTSGPQANQFLQDMLLTYGQQLSPTWHLSTSVGLTSNIGTGASGTGIALAGRLTKKFQKSEIGISYNRGHGFNGYITSQVSDRVDVVERTYWTRRFSTSGSFSYFRTTGTPTNTGLYTIGQLSYRVTRHMSLVGSVAHVSQTGNGVYFLNGHRNLFVTGIRWDARPSTDD